MLDIAIIIGAFCAIAYSTYYLLDSMVQVYQMTENVYLPDMMQVVINAVAMVYVLSHLGR